MKKLGLLIIGGVILLGWLAYRPTPVKAQETKAVHYDVCGKTAPGKRVILRDKEGDILDQTISGRDGSYILEGAANSANPFPWSVEAEGCETICILNESDFEPGTCTGGMGKHKDNVNLCYWPMSGKK